MEDKIKRVVQFYGINESKAKDEINKQNKLRAKHYKYYTNKEWNKKRKIKRR